MGINQFKIYFKLIFILFCSFLLKTVSAEEASALMKLEHVTHYFDTLDLIKHRIPATESTNPVCKVNDEYVVELPIESIEEYILAGVNDNLTVIRLFSELAKRVNESGYALCGNGDDVNDIIKRNNIELGLSLPMTDLAYYAWHPGQSNLDTGSITKLYLVYRSSYVHRFSDEVLPADLKIGADEEITYLENGVQRHGKLMDMNLFISTKGIGFSDISGLAARPHGIMGVILDVLFFIPDAVDSMYIKQNKLITEALITTKIDEFETTSKYQMHRTH